ncbi:hypothetical protein [uncultured Gimesia sp.]|uniref:hypothetical protein n=1 Tax=uncultured Gimesia sp. TaxID=1678688 RepID=UPI0030DA6C7E|tara:strand:- start:112819 stop:113922 length:1104 start_codon:yes stop_codon:yes gene_type:complete
MNEPENRLRQKPILRSAALSYTCLSILLLFTGCGGGTPPATPQPQPTATPAQAPATSVAQTAPTQPAKSDEKKDSRKTIDGIPYDVWFDNPLAVAGNNQAVAPVSLPGNTVAATPTTPAPAGEMKPAAASGTPTSGGIDWKTIMPMPVLESQVKDIRNRLTKNMQSVGTYNNSYLEIPMFTSTLAALAGIVTEHPEDVGWKKNAKHLRDLAAGISAAPLKRGAKSFREIQVPYEQIIVIMNGSLPAGIAAADEKKPLSEVASMGDLMKRADIASKWLKSNVGNADALKSEKEKVIEEAHLLAAISKIITTEGYGYVDDKGFLNHANPMSDASLKMVEAAKGDNFPQFDESLTRVYKACTQCHSEYKE